MWSTIAALAGQLGLYDIMNAINRTTDPNKINELASKILIAADKKGTAALRRAEAVITNIPSIASSPTVQGILRNKRREAIDNYARVEERVTGMKNDAQNLANQISDINNKPMLQKLTKGKEMMKDAENTASSFIDKVDKTDFNKIEEKI